MKRLIIVGSPRTSGRSAHLAEMLFEANIDEHPEDELKARRIAFYKRLGFCQNDYPYIQPSYRKGGKGVPLILMSYPKKLDNCENTASVLYKKIYNK